MTANASKAVVKAYYGADPQWTYVEGCSTGGHQGLMEAQRYPNDFDAIVVGAPVFNYQALNMSHVWMLQKLFRDKFAGNLAFDRNGDGIPESLTKWQILKDAVLAKCDEKDGIKDGASTTSGLSALTRSTPSMSALPEPRMILLIGWLRISPAIDRQEMHAHDQMVERRCVADSIACFRALLIFSDDLDPTTAARVPQSKHSSQQSPAVRRERPLSGAGRRDSSRGMT